MKFEFLIALKYLVPRLRQLSVSIISVISIIVISLVVWLVIVFLSVTDGIEKKWINQLVCLDSPIKITPKEAYYDSYYYQIDQMSARSDYSAKTLMEKLKTEAIDPYDPNMDPELPVYFPKADLDEKGEIKDLVKELWASINTLPYPVTADEFEVAFANLRLNLVRDSKSPLLLSQKDPTTTFVSQVSYVTTIDENNANFQKLILEPSLKDLRLLFSRLGLATSPVEDLEVQELSVNENNYKQNLDIFFKNIQIEAFETSKYGWALPVSFYPKQGTFQGIGIVKNGLIRKAIIPKQANEIPTLQEQLDKLHITSISGAVVFDENRVQFIPNQKTTYPIDVQIKPVLAPGIVLPVKQVADPLNQADELSSIKFPVSALIQGILLSGMTTSDALEIGQAKAITHFSSEPASPPFWVYKKGHSTLPRHEHFGDSILLSKSFQANGVCIGDQGYLSFYSSSGGSSQEQRLPVYVAGFYDPGLMPIGSKLIFADGSTVAALRGNISIADKTLGNGVHIRFPKIEDAASMKAHLIEELKKRSVDQYFTVESYTDYEFSRSLLQQLKSDKTLFTLIAIIILIVACSNIISMLILLVNDKKREIGILQSLGASSASIAAIFGLCGFLLGIISCFIGTVAALLTLSNLQYLIDFLSFIQGHEAFQSAFYGNSLPNELSFNSLLFVLIATIVISLLAGIAPAIKASLLKPSQILRGE